MRSSQRCGQLSPLPPAFQGCLTLKKSPQPGNGQVITLPFKTTAPIHKPRSHANLASITLKPSDVEERSAGTPCVPGCGAGVGAAVGQGAAGAATLLLRSRSSRAKKRASSSAYTQRDRLRRAGTTIYGSQKPQNGDTPDCMYEIDMNLLTSAAPGSYSLSLQNC